MKASVLIGPKRTLAKNLRMILLVSYQEAHAQRAGFMEEERVEILVDGFDAHEVYGISNDGTPVKIQLLAGAE